MRTTIDLPDDLYRALKARAALAGISLRQLIQRVIEQGLHGREPVAANRHAPPPVIIPPRGVPIHAIPQAEMRRIEEEEDVAKHARSAGC